MEEFNPFRFDGRIGRLQYFGYGIIWALVIFLVTVLAGGSRGALGLYIVLMLVFFVGTGACTTWAAPAGGTCWRSCRTPTWCWAWCCCWCREARGRTPTARV